MAGGTVKLGPAGPVKKTWLYLGGAATVGIVGYAWWRNRSADPVLVAPATGEDYASDAAGGPGVTSGYGGGATTVGPTVEMPPATNAEWTRRATEYLGDIGYDPGTVAAVLGKFLGRQPLTADEAGLVRTAIGSIGPVPIGEFPIVLVTTPAPAAPAPATPAAPAPAAPAAPAAQYVTVAKFTTRNPPWNSTLWGIAAHYHTSVGALQRLNSLRGTSIHPGQRLRVK